MTSDSHVRPRARLARTTRCAGGADEDAGSKAVGALAPHSACARAAGDEKGQRSPSERAQGSRVLHDLSPATGHRMVLPPLFLPLQFNLCPTPALPDALAAPAASTTRPSGESVPRVTTAEAQPSREDRTRDVFEDGIWRRSLFSFSRCHAEASVPTERPSCRGGDAASVPACGARPAAQVSTRRPACVRGAATLSPGVTSRPAGPRQTSEIYTCGTGGNSWPRGRPVFMTGTASTLPRGLVS